MILQGNAVRALTTGHDWTMGNGSAGYLQGNQAIAQQLDCRILQILGECFWDAGAGINWYGFLSSKAPQGLSLAIQAVILNTVNVLGINQPATFTLNPQTRLFSVDWDVITIYSKSFTGTTQQPVQIGG
ncbi:MAG TPA: hypothetical protein VMT55_00140 [Candidatus Sulfotelmatobacter sp.]|nr:hypothetical protein [Candidatus Sulfotelmatobacter sp.]